MSSRWATDNHEQESAAAERKRLKEEKRRAREEKQKRRAEAPELEQAAEAEKPRKRRRTSSAVEEVAEAHLLSFPSLKFSPSRNLDVYEVLNNIQEGSYGFVSRAKERATGEIVALKRLKVEPSSGEGFPITGLREIQTLRACSHTHIVHLREVVIGSSPWQE